MQKKAMQQLKQHLNRQRFAYKDYSESPAKKAKQSNEPPPAKKVDIQEPGMIVKIHLPEPCYEPKKLKVRMLYYINLHFL